MMIASITTSGKPGKEIEAKLFDTPVHTHLLAQAVRVWRANQRQGTAKTKTRGEVELTKKKVYAQKHTGNARHGAMSAPIFVGGGVAHGPHGNANWSLRLSSTMRKTSLLSAFCAQAANHNIFFLNDISKASGKTKEIYSMLTTAQLADKDVLLVVTKASQALVRAVKNLKHCSYTDIDRVNVYEVLSADRILFTEDAFAILEARYAKKQEKPMNVEIKKETKEKVTPKKVVKKAVAAKSAPKPKKKEEKV